MTSLVRPPSTTLAVHDGPPRRRARGSTAQEQRFEAFYSLFLDLLARLVRARAAGGSGAPELALAQRLIPEARLPQWAELWQTALRERDEAVLLNLDRKALILGTLARLEALARP